MKFRQLVDAFVNAITGPSPVADLETINIVIGGSSAFVSTVGAGRYGGLGASVGMRPTGEETYWLQKTAAGDWNLLHKNGSKPEGKQTVVLGSYGTLEEAAPELRRVSDALKKRQGGFWGSASGALYFEDGGEKGLKAVERAIALKNEPSSAPAPQKRL